MKIKKINKSSFPSLQNLLSSSTLKIIGGITVVVVVLLIVMLPIYFFVIKDKNNNDVRGNPQVPINDTSFELENIADTGFTDYFLVLANKLNLSQVKNTDLFNNPEYNARLTSDQIVQKTILPLKLNVTNLSPSIENLNGNLKFKHKVRIAYSYDNLDFGGGKLNNIKFSLIYGTDEFKTNRYVLNLVNLLIFSYNWLKKHELDSTKYIDAFYKLLDVRSNYFSNAKVDVAPADLEVNDDVSPFHSRDIFMEIKITFNDENNKFINLKKYLLRSDLFNM